jgi:restriction endonuclease S subunit
MQYNMESTLMRVGDLVTLFAGPNVTRIKKDITGMEMYSIASMDEDLAQAEGQIPAAMNSTEKYCTRVGDLVVGMIKGRASIVSPKNAGCFLSSNFVRCDYDASVLDPWFFCFWLNESEEVRRQNHQNTGRALYTPLALEMLSITLPSLPQQKQIGGIYKKMKHLEYLKDKQKSQMNELAMQLIKNSLKEE